MLYRETIAVCSQIHTKHKNTLCGQNVELLNVKLAVNIVTTGLYPDMILSCDTMQFYQRLQDFPNNMLPLAVRSSQGARRHNPAQGLTPPNRTPSLIIP